MKALIRQERKKQHVERAQQRSHVLPAYANPTNLKGPLRTANSEIYKIQYTKAGKNIILEEDITLDGERHILELTTVKYVIETNTNEEKELGVHRHPGTGHNQPHLQFKIRATDNRVIRIPLENITWDDYRRCIKGFLHLATDILRKEEQTNNTPGLADYFFNEQVAELENERLFLIGKIQEAEKHALIFDENDTPLNKKELTHLKKDDHLLPFFQYG